MSKIKVCIIGTGNIGTDLLVKLKRLQYVQIVCFVGRRSESEGILFAKRLRVLTSNRSINFFIQNPNCCDVVFDCTSSNDAIENYKVFSMQNIKVIDLTPSKIGQMCVPEINSDDVLNNNNVNMITCGGQASLPLLYVMSKNCENIKYIQIVSQISSKSAGMATRININDYITTTQLAIKKFIHCQNVKVIINLNPAVPQVDMQTTMFVQSEYFYLDSLIQGVVNSITNIRTYVPGYQLVISPMVNQNNILITNIKVRGLGDFLPQYAGNLDIINCCAIKLLGKLYER